MNIKGSLSVNADDIKYTSIWTTGSGTIYGLPEADGILETIGTPNGWIKGTQRFTSYSGSLYVRSLQSDGVTWTIWRSVAFR